ncbi:MAG: hypothetical protein HY235_23305 [Acidobacteria bacterium]|nr:hypothetical protein [Acidobacteriota bacterium]
MSAALPSPLVAWKKRVCSRRRFAHRAQDVRDRLDAGAHHVQIATAAMLDPLLAIRIRQGL